MDECQACGKEMYDYEKVKCPTCGAEIHNTCRQRCFICRQQGCSGCFILNEDTQEYLCGDDCADNFAELLKEETFKDERRFEDGQEE